MLATIGDKIVETLYSNKVTSEDKRISTLLPCPIHSKLGCLLFSIGPRSGIILRAFVYVPPKIINFFFQKNRPTYLLLKLAKKRSKGNALIWLMRVKAASWLAPNTATVVVMFPLTKNL